MPSDWPTGWDVAWPIVGKTSNTVYYVDDEGVLLALPHAGAHDTGPTAHENVEFQKFHFDANHLPPIVAIFFDRLASQDRAARKVYADDPSPQWSVGFALIGGSMLSRAMGSFFLGLSQPQTPVKMFTTLQEARPWIRERQRAHRARV
ncbi:MAG: hypothetical protein AAF799_37485 [Myxococcota bacterium]